jgi:hypothetical protein
MITTKSAVKPRQAIIESQLPRLDSSSIWGMTINRHAVALSIMILVLSAGVVLVVARAAGMFFRQPGALSSPVNQEPTSRR